MFEGRGKARVLVGHTKKAHAPPHDRAREFWVFPTRACGYVCGYFSAWLVQKCFALSGLVRVGAALGEGDPRGAAPQVRLAISRGNTLVCMNALASHPLSAA